MPERRIRRLNEPGHRRKFLVVVDESVECESAIYFAACRATNTNSSIVLLYVIEPADFQHWLSVENVHREEGENKAKAVFRLYQRKLKSLGFEDIDQEEVIRAGDIREELVALINDDEDISFLVLGASTSAKGPGRLVSWLGDQGAGTFPIPFVVVPGTLELEEIKALC
ncbi:MAG: universal stress protein [Methyloligellaceae bacterium]